MRAADAFAPAKINLSLHVTGQRADGYHLLDSLVVFSEVGDRLWFDDAQEMSLEVTGPFSEGVPVDESNLVWRAADLAGATQRIHLEKNLPHGAGIGGGSADAAAVLRYFQRPEVAGALGADVPVCLNDRPQRMRGIGDQLAPVDHFPALDIVLVNPGVTVPTPRVFHALHQKSNNLMNALPETAHLPDVLAWLRAQRNDLEDAARTIAPIIGVALDALGQAEIARMSGSGATCFGVFEDAARADAAAAGITAAHPDWWVQATRTVPAR